MKMVSVLTGAQAEVLEVFVERAEQGLPPPSHRDLMARFGWKSPAAARGHVAALVRKGVLELEAGASRGAYLAHSVVRRVPIVEQVDARGGLGRAIWQLPLPPQLHPDGDAFGFHVRGKSLADRGILDGDLIIALRTGTTFPGALAIVSTNGRPKLAPSGPRGRQVVGLAALVVRSLPVEEGE